MDKYVTVVSVDDQLQMASVVGVTSAGTSAASVVVAQESAVVAGKHTPSMMVGAATHREGSSVAVPEGEVPAAEPEDSQFVTVLSINHGGGSGGGGEKGARGKAPSAPEVVLVYRLPGERLGFGLKFQGGTKSNEKIQRLFIQSCAENSPASRVQASWGHLREGDEILEIDGVSVTRMTRIECVKCLKDSNVAIKLLVRNGEGKVQNFYGATDGHSAGGGTLAGGEGGGGSGELPERKGAPPPPPPVPPRKLNKRKQSTVEQQQQPQANGGEVGNGGGPPSKQAPPVEPFVPPPDPETYSNLFAVDDISDLISESDDTASTISTVVDKFSICSSLSSEDYTIPSNGPNGIGQSLELAKALKPFTLLEQEFNLESKFEPTKLFTFKPPPPASSTSSSSLTNVVQLEVPAAVVEKPQKEYENVTIMKVDENRNYENVSLPYGGGPYENVTIQTVQPYENMVLSSRVTGGGRRAGGVAAVTTTTNEPKDSGGVYENVELKTSPLPVPPPRPLPRQAAVVEPKKRAPIPVPIPIVVPPPRLKPVKLANGAGAPSSAVGGGATALVPGAPLGAEYGTIQNWLQEATEVIHECALVPNASSDAPEEQEDKAPSSVKPTTPAPQQAGAGGGTNLPRLIDFHPKVSQPMEGLEEVEAVAPPASPTMGVRYEGPPAQPHPEDNSAEEDSQYDLPPPEAIVRKCIKIISSEDHTYIESSSSDEDDDEKLYGRSRSEDEDDRSSVLSREATTPEQFLSGDAYSDEDGEKLGPPEIVSGGPSEAYFNFPWTSNLLPPIGEVEEEYSSLEHQHNGPIVIIDTADETVINDTNNNQQRERKKQQHDGGDDESRNRPLQLALAVRPSSIPVASAEVKMSAMDSKQRAATGTSSSSGSDSDADQERSGSPDGGEAGGRQSRESIELRDQTSDSNGGCFTPDSLDEAYDEPAQVEVEEDTPEPSVNSTAADKADELSAAGAKEVVSTCEHEIVPSVASVEDDSIEFVNATDGASVEQVERQEEVKEPEIPELEVDQSAVAAAMEESEESAHEAAIGRGDMAEAETEAADKAPPGAGEEENPSISGRSETKRREADEEREQLDDSNIDAICGDVDIVVGDTVESDFEELVKAQVEPLDVEDSSEQIQQIHERIIVGIERADVSDEGEQEGGKVLLPAVADGAAVKIGTPDEVGPAKDQDLPDAAVTHPEEPTTPSAAETVPEVNSECLTSETDPVPPASDKQQQEPERVQTVELQEEEEKQQEQQQSQPEIDPVEQESRSGSDEREERDEGSAGGGPPSIIPSSEQPAAKPSEAAPGSVTSMDPLNNVVTTTTTVTAIASTVHQLIPTPSAAPSAAAAASATAPATAAAAAIGGKAAPPAFSRLPPDGHEFPPNFTEPSAITASSTSTNAASPTSSPVNAVAAMAIMNGGGPVSAPALAKSNDKHSSFNDDLPELPKSHPPPVPRKVLRPDHVASKGGLNNNTTTTTNGGGTTDVEYRSKPPPPPFQTRSASIAESMLTRGKDLPTSYQTLQSVFEQRRRSVDTMHSEHHHHHAGKPPTAPTSSGRISLVGSNWRKDERSEKSVRDKIAMFSSAAAAEGEGEQTGAPLGRKFSKDFTKSSENLLGGGASSASRKTSVEAIEAYATLRKKAHSVEHLVDEVDKAAPSPVSTFTESSVGSSFPSSSVSAYNSKAKFGLETSKPVVLGKAYSVENLNPAQRNSETGSNGKSPSATMDTSNKVLARTISFSGYAGNGSSLASIATNSPSDERWKSSISSLLEQRKKSMSKLRGLVIPEKVPEAEVLADARIIGLPIIKSKDSEIILSSGVTAASKDTSYALRTSTLPTPAKSSVQSVTREEAFRKPLPPLPPAKPPRTSLVYPGRAGSSDGLRSTEDESGDDDSDSVLSSRVSSPPASPVVPVAARSTPTAGTEKYPLTRTLSSETNTSVTSSNSTLTSSSGSQASCSSVGSTPTVDISNRKLSKSSSSEASMNRKNVLASAKCRSGRGDLKIEDAANGKMGGVGAGVAARRYEDGDSTDGYEQEEERRKVSKSKAREERKEQPTHYKVLDRQADSLVVDKVIKVASYVEVVSDLEDGGSVIEEVSSPVLVATAKPLVLAEKQPEPAPLKSRGAKHDPPMSDLAKWVRHEAARSISSHKNEALAESKLVSPPSMAPRTPAPVPVKRELRSSVETKKLNLAEIRRSFESKSANATVIPTPVRQPTRDTIVLSSTPVAASVPTPAATTTPPSAGTTTHATPKSTNGHDRFSSWDSLASSSSGVSSLQTSGLGLGRGGGGSSGGQNSNSVTGSSQTLQSTPSDYGSFSSLGSSHSLITPQDLQLIIEEADPPLATPDAFVVVLQRETPESSIGITLAGGSDYEAKEITIHKILTNSPADRDGRLRKGDRILSINGLSMRGLTHRESLSVLKTPRPEVVMVITRSKSLVLDTLTKLKRPSMGSLSSLAEKSELVGAGAGGSEYERKMKIQHKASRSLDLDHLDGASNEAESVFDGTASEDGLLSADDVSKCSSSNANDSAPAYAVELLDGCRMVEINKDGAGLGFSIEGGYDSPTGNKPLIIKKIFMGGAAEKSGLLRAGEEIVAINDASIANMTRIQVWNMMKKLPNGSVRITLK